jgi:hypothetical protein
MTCQFLQETLIRLLKSIYVLPHEHPLIPSFFFYLILSSLCYSKICQIRLYQRSKPKPVFFYLILSSLRFSFEPKIIILQKTI